MKKTILKILFTFLLFSLISCTKSEKYHFLLGTYTSTGKSEGIYTYRFDEKNGFKQIAVTPNVTNPSYLAFSPDKKYAYAVNENGNESTVSAFIFSAGDGKLELLNKVPANGADPCYITVTGNHAITANYTGGNISVFNRNADGSLSEAVQVVQHRGNSIDTTRQLSAHVHQVVFSPNGVLYANDLGLDKIFLYSYNPDSESEILTRTDSISVKAGSGPRHITFSADGKFAYLLQELDGTLTVFEAKEAKLTVLQETNIAQKQDVVVGGSDIHLSPDGKFLYAANRGTANDITCFAVQPDGTLSFVQQIASGGIKPRNFAITPDGKYLFAENEESNSIVAFLRNIETGTLTQTKFSTTVGAPVCIVFY